MPRVNVCRLLILLISATCCLSLPSYGGLDNGLLPPVPQQELAGHVDVVSIGPGSELQPPVPQLEEADHVDVVSTIDNSHCAIQRQVCVRKTHCLDHLINTEDAEVIALRINSELQCTDPDHPDAHAVCCSDPGAPVPAVSSHPVNSKPEETSAPVVPAVHKADTYIDCPGHMVCVSQGQCDQHGNVLTDGSGLIDIRIKNKNCVVDKIRQELGVCCTPPGQDIKEPVSTIKPTKIERAPSQCGIRQKTKHDIPAERVLGNIAHNEAEFGEFPWQAIIFLSNFTFKCGATLVGDRWLLTAAHCVNGIKPHGLNVRLGEWKVNTFDEPLPYVDSMVASITIHPKYNSRNLHNDIALLELKEPVPLQYHVNSICLPSHSQTYWGQRCISTGWGKNAFNGRYQTIMKKVELPLVDHTTCQHNLRRTRLGRYFNLDKSFICAGGEKNEDACKGDGGGPLACQDPDSGRYVLTGITAWGIGCGHKNIPGVFVNVQAFMPWIQTIISDSHESTSQEYHNYENIGNSPK
ncbi:unnamed protein product [Meganyctiphanes norvegica]|uniref:Peptidase S1 domain-containing protein n=1 Tax=Meganyctiphanes norvegica TaxID=48144 RepID=A0AAV2PVB4_MEGNR